jgi:hypothetical protein
LKYGLIKPPVIPTQVDKKAPITWPIFINSDQKEFMDHFTSFPVDAFGYQKNSKNILFCMGPSCSGKTWFLK